MNIANTISLLGGLAFFLFGMSLLGEGLKRVAGRKLEIILAKLTSTTFRGVLLGTFVTAIIQSSSATTVMVVGFVNSGIMKLANAIGIIMGANIGTTATGWILVLAGVEGRDIYISEYVKYSGMYTKFTTLFSYDSNPVIFAGVNALGNREVVFGFDIHKSDFAISSDFTPLISNLLKYSCPAVIDSADYTCGEDLNVNITANIDSVKVVSPNGEENYLDTSTDVGVMTLDRVGTYRVEVVTSDSERAYEVYASVPVAESDITATGGDFSVTGEKTFDKTDGKYDPLVLLFVLLAVVFCADWMVYCYEKYQLR